MCPPATEGQWLRAAGGQREGRHDWRSEATLVLLFSQEIFFNLPQSHSPTPVSSWVVYLLVFIFVQPGTRSVMTVHPLHRCRCSISQSSLSLSLSLSAKVHDSDLPVSLSKLIIQTQCRNQAADFSRSFKGTPQDLRYLRLALRRFKKLKSKTNCPRSATHPPAFIPVEVRRKCGNGRQTRTEPWKIKEVTDSFVSWPRHIGREKKTEIVLWDC